METWVTVLSVILGSSLVLEIYRNVREYILSRRDKRMNLGAVPKQMESLNDRVRELTKNTEKGFKEVYRKLDNDRIHFEKIDDILVKMQEAVNYNAEGTALGLENDIVIFNAFRNHHINGESEIAEGKVKSYLLNNVKDHLHL